MPLWQRCCCWCHWFTCLGGELCRDCKPAMYGAAMYAQGYGGKIVSVLGCSFKVEHWPSPVPEVGILGMPLELCAYAVVRQLLVCAYMHGRRSYTSNHIRSAGARLYASHVRLARSWSMQMVSIICCGRCCRLLALLHVLCMGDGGRSSALVGTQGIVAMSEGVMGCHAAPPAWHLYIMLSAS